MPGPAAALLRVRGRVQGVGFRPFVVRAASECRLAGWVRNVPEGVLLHVEGDPVDLADFHERLTRDAPPAARIAGLAIEPTTPQGLPDFQILNSLAGDAGQNEGGSAPTSGRVEITPDLAACPSCLAEFDDPADRRHGYALNGCTDCGPRFTIQYATPFDRARTAMDRFPPCADCLREYATPADRRFHAQNIACPRCGPRVWLEEGTAHPALSIACGGRDEPSDFPSLERAAALLRTGAIIAVQGIGGFHLLCDATDPAVIGRLRTRKRRERKPLAVLFTDMEQVRTCALLDADSSAALTGPAAPIVLLPRRPDGPLAAGIAPGLGTVGAMIAYTPLHKALVRLAGGPLVATSANASDEPMPIDPATARAELAGIADAFLLHDRPIVRHADDSVARIVGNRAVPLRVGRGLAPLRLELPLPEGVELPPILATGGHLKAAVALGQGRELWLGPHIGDLATPAVRRRYRDSVADLGRLLRIEPQVIAHDAHPDYFTTRYAQESGKATLAVQHHHAHVLACLLENGWTGPALGVSWDGTGYGADGGTWGGEFLAIDQTGRYRRVGSLWPFPLVGGDRAAREPRRSAAGACHAAGVPLPTGLFDETELRWLVPALDSPRTSSICTSAGRLFDAWSALLGLSPRSAYEGEAAIRLEELADTTEQGAWPDASFPVILAPSPLVGEGWGEGAAHPPRPDDRTTSDLLRDPETILRLDWRPWVAEMLQELAAGASSAILAARFHDALARGTLEMARRVGLETVALTGGCFQNRRLSERTEALLSADGFRVLTHRLVPPGDGGLAVGQLWAAALRTTS